MIFAKNAESSSKPLSSRKYEYFFSAYSPIFCSMKFVCKSHLTVMHSFSCFSPFSGKPLLKSPGFQQEFSTGRGETPPKINKIKGIYFCFPYFQQFCLLKTRLFSFGKAGQIIFCGCLNVEFPDIFRMNITKKYSPQTRDVYILFTYFRTQITK